MNKQKKLHPFYLFPLGYVISLYLLPVFMSIESDTHPLLAKLVWLPVFFAIVNILVCVRFCKAENRMLLFNSAVLVKYTMIPFYIIGGLGILCSLLISIIPVPFMIFFGPTIALIGSVAGWLILAFEAPYVISYLYISTKTGNCSKVMAWVHSILQFFFFLDVVDIMFLTLKERRWKKLTIFIISVFVILIVLVLFLGVVGLITLVKS